ncbi:MAG: hypothetical protein HUJ98_14640, partial [Bacteroidaceae bacterium]|nr:hypothetical protein [Bacteroidaceae bacterium]
EIALSNGKSYTKTLKQAATETNPNPNTNLVPGKIHRLGYMPKLPPSDLDPAKWMEYIPRNVYLSEISIPGSWNSLNPKFQGSNPSIATQYSNGVRMFHLDTRYRTNKNSGPTRWETDFTLGVANNGANYDYSDNGDANDGKVMQKDACSTFSEYLKNITDNVKTTEYMVLICTFAQNSATPRKVWDESNNRRNWMEDVSSACASNGKVYDGKSITANTTVGDVLGSVIVIVASETAVSGMTALNDSKCLFVQMPNERNSAMYPTTAGYFDAQAMYKGNKTTNGLAFNCTQAQISSNGTSAIETSKRGYAPTMTQRQTVGGNILTWAKNNYASQDTYQHNQWMYQGLGGYKVSNTSASEVSDSYEGIASEMSTWIRGKISEMSPTGATRYYPVGL